MLPTCIWYAGSLLFRLPPGWHVFGSSQQYFDLEIQYGRAQENPACIPRTREADPMTGLRLLGIIPANRGANQIRCSVPWKESNWHYTPSSRFSKYLHRIYSLTSLGPEHNGQGILCERSWSVGWSMMSASADISWEEYIYIYIYKLLLSVASTKLDRQETVF
jgi:hypothetical protein